MSLRVLDLLSSNQRRGAQVFAVQLLRALRGRVDQRVAVLRESPDGVRFDVPTVFLDGDRMVLPGVRVSLRAVRALRRLISEWEPDIVHFSGGELLKHAVPAAAGRHTRLVYRRIGSAVGRDFHGPRRLFYRALLAGVTAVVAVGEEVRRETIETLRQPPERVITIRGGREVASMRPARDRHATRRALGLGPESEVLLWLGALTWEKDPLAALDVLTRLRRDRPGAVLLLAGDGPLRGALDAEVTARGMEGAVRILGSRADVPDLLAASDVAILTSRTEGIPGLLIEAGMTGLPAVSYDVVGVPEVVENGRTGILVPSGDVEALAVGALRLLGDVAARRRMGEAARERCLATFDIATAADRYVALYRELTGR